MNRADTVKTLTRLREIDGEVRFERGLIAEIEAEYYTPSVGGGLDGTPRAKGATSNPTENTALNIPDTARAERKESEARINALYALKREITREINALDYKKKTVIYDFYIRGYRWAKIAAKLYYSATHCKRLRHWALIELGRAFDSNVIIQTFDRPATKK